MVVCLAALKYGKDSVRTVARVREEEYLEGDALNAEELGLSALVGPERAVAGEVVNLLSYEGAGEIHHLCEGRVALLELPLSPDSPLVHETLAELRGDLPMPSLVAAVRGPNGLRIPRGNDTMRADERAYILTEPDSADEWWILSGKPWHHVSHVLLIGCGNIGYHLVMQLESRGLFPTIIEKNRSRAEWLSKKLTKSLVLHGDGTDTELLREQLTERSDAVVVLIDDDHEAVLVGLFAKELGAKKVVVRCDQLDYAPIAHKLGIDALISPQRAVADRILRYIRRGRIAGLHMLGDHEGEIIDIKVPDKPLSPEILEKPLSKLKFPDGTLLGVVVRDDEVAIASGKTVLRPGDDLLVVTMPHAIHAVEKLLG
jgi:trk system potassium uptake protein TrkA